MMAKFMGKNISLRELAGRPESSLQLVKETEIDVHLLVGRAIEGARCRLGRATSGRSYVSKQNQLRVPVWNSTLLKNSRPGLLRVVEYKRNKLHRWLLAGVTLAIGLTECLPGSRPLIAEQGEEISLEHEAKHEEDEESANPEVHTADTASAFVSAILNIVASSAWSPTHNGHPTN